MEFYYYTIPILLPTFNEIIDVAKKHWATYRAMKKSYTDVCALACRDLPIFDSEISIMVDWYMPNRRKDKDNIAAGVKFIWDGLKQAGKIPDDGWDYQGNTSHFYTIDKDNPRIYVTVMP